MEVIRIKYDKDDIIQKSKEVEVCFKCSACSLFCPVTLNVSKYDIENAFIAQLFNAEESIALKDVWMCCVCEKCLMICPQNADPSEVFNNLKQLSYSKGLAPASVYGLAKQILKTGIAFDIGAKLNADRKKQNLRELTPNENVIKELNILAEKTALKTEAD